LSLPIKICSPNNFQVEGAQVEAEPKQVVINSTNSSKILSRQDLIEYFKSFKTPEKEVTCIGLVGYPNVGKSSTINSLLQEKKVSVSTTPGKTKHFQVNYHLRLP